MIGNMGEESQIWTEKYRPKDFTHIKGQNDVVDKIKAFVEKKNMPHLMFSGPAGVGKTTLSIVIARKLFGESWKENLLELNASDERGIDVIRDKVKNFARTKAIGDVPFKIIYLDESDALTTEAQQALRRIMENYTKTCRFILSCNYSSKIIDPIQSRCALFRFKPLSKEHIFEIIETISKNEKIEITSDGREALYKVSEGDCRKLENIMQACSAVADKVDEKVVFSIGSMARPDEIKEMLSKALMGKFVDSKNILIDTMLKYGLSGIDVIKQIQSESLNLPVDDRKKLEIIRFCGEIEFRLVEGSDPIIQLEALIAMICFLSEK